MSDIMRPMSFGHLMNWVLSEHSAQGTIFGVSKIVEHRTGRPVPSSRRRSNPPSAPPPVPIPSWPRT